VWCPSQNKCIEADYVEENDNRADFERERERADALMAELLKMTAERPCGRRP
jgi:hypothetical protein